MQRKESWSAIGPHSFSSSGLLLFLRLINNFTPQHSSCLCVHSLARKHSCHPSSCLHPVSLEELSQVPQPTCYWQLGNLTTLSSARSELTVWVGDRGWAKQETEYSGHFNELLKTDRFSYSSIVQLVPLCSNFYLADLVCFYSFGRFHFMIFCISEIVVQKKGSHYRHHQHFLATWMSDNQENEIMEQDFDIQLLFFEFVYGFMK